MHHFLCVVHCCEGLRSSCLQHRMLLTCNFSCCLTGMAGWKLRFVLLLTLSVGFGSEVTVKTIGREPDATPICSNMTENIVTLLVCKIHRERNGEECLLLYRYGGGDPNENTCDSRFTLMTENHTVFLHLTSLTPVDSGNYTCQCSHADGMDVLNLSITVEEGDARRSTHQLIVIGLIGATIVISITAVIFGFICKRKCCGDGLRAATSGSSGCETPDSFDADDPDDPYTSLQQPAGDLYQTAAHSTSNMKNICFDNQEMDGEADQRGQDIYENIKL